MDLVLHSRPYRDRLVYDLAFLFWLISALVAPSVVFAVQDWTAPDTPDQVLALPCVDLFSPTLTAPTYMTAGANGTATVPFQSGSTYSWSLSGGSIFSGQGTNQISLTAGAAGITMLLGVARTNSSGCTTATVQTKIEVDFADVLLDGYHDSIVTAVRFGTMLGCGGGNFCPSSSVTRAQMAGYLLRAEHGGSYYPPPATGIFGDVLVTDPDAPWIERIYNEGITAGCQTNPLRYCSSDPATRAQMAVFLLKTKYVTGYVPPSCTGIFADVQCTPTKAFAVDWIEDLFREGITTGCGGNNYCPDLAVPQNQMAVFLVKAFSLVDPAATWYLDDSIPNGVSTTDFSGNGNVGSISGTVVVPGVAGYARQFRTNLSDWIYSNATPSVNIARDITLEAWVQPATAADNRILNKSPNSGSPASYPGNFDLYLDSGRHLWYLHEKVGGYNSYSSSATIPLNIWSHVAVTWGAGRVKFYINGSLVTDAADAGETALTSSTIVRIGRRADATKFEGYIDEVKIWPYARTPRQIASAYLPETTCYRANPTDALPDDVALQACIDLGGAVRLRPGSPGYIIQNTLRVQKDYTVLTSTATPSRPIMFAGASLRGTILNLYKTGGMWGAHVSWLEFQGNRANRLSLPQICQPESQGGFHGSNVDFGRVGNSPTFTEMKNFAFDDNITRDALCGTGAELYGTDYEVLRNQSLSNGAGREDPNNHLLWADGITLARCIGGIVRSNNVIDATDIAIVDGGGAGCQITSNIVSNPNHHAFAGIALANFCFPGSCGDHTGTLVSGNVITASIDRLSFGFALGPHPWGFPPDLRAVGATVTGNSVSGATVNVEVDGVDQLTFTGNTIGVRQGTPLCSNGGTTVAYAVNSAHAGASTLQTGWSERSYDSCIP